jgi:hypothetical protein
MNGSEPLIIANPAKLTFSENDRKMILKIHESVRPGIAS